VGPKIGAWEFACNSRSLRIVSVFVFGQLFPSSVVKSFPLRHFSSVAPRPTERYQSFGWAGSNGFKMHTAYILKDASGKEYKGMTGNLKRRLSEHRSGHTTTMRMKNLSLVYTKEYDIFVEARKRELYFKSAAGRRFLKDKLPE